VGSCLGLRSWLAAAAIALAACRAAAPPASRAPEPRPAPVRLVFDTDMVSDCDDAAALAVLHALADRGEVEILATMVSTKNPWSAPAVDVINTYYGRPDIPIGVPKGRGVDIPSKFVQGLAEAFPHDLRSAAEAADAARLYRAVLEAAPDRGVTLVTVGYLTNVRDLLRLPAEGGHASGRELASRKVRRWVCMGGNFKGRPARDDKRVESNVNFERDAEAAYEAINGWPGPIMFVGREIGSVPSGLRAGRVLETTPASNPVRRAYELYFGGEVKDRHVADPTAVLYAVRGLRDYWDAETTGYMDLRPDTSFEWRYDRDGDQGYLLKKRAGGVPNDAYIVREIEALLVRPPRR
jgi:inosine-uridine nucleoside N-ribohydrolase